MSPRKSLTSWLKKFKFLCSLLACITMISGCTTTSYQQKIIVDGPFLAKQVITPLLGDHVIYGSNTLTRIVINEQQTNQLAAFAAYDMPADVVLTMTAALYNHQHCFKTMVVHHHIVLGHQQSIYTSPKMRQTRRLMYEKLALQIYSHTQSPSKKKRQHHHIKGKNDLKAVV